MWTYTYAHKHCADLAQQAETLARVTGSVSAAYSDGRQPATTHSATATREPVRVATS